MDGLTDMLDDAPKLGRKVPQVLQGARKVFLDHGFEGASVDDIARESGVSKATLYSYFPDKEKLFAAVIQQSCEAQVADLKVTLSAKQCPIDGLHAAARSVVRLMLSKNMIPLFRLCVAEATRFPDLGFIFYTTGPKVWRSEVAEFLRKATARGALVIAEDDFDLAAEHLTALCKTDVFYQNMFCDSFKPSKEDIDAVAQQAVETFLARFGSDHVKAAQG
ncbi:MAG: TetR/AcrR family transcriptional regulator [Pseudomonadota bacterium]